MSAQDRRAVSRGQDGEIVGRAFPYVDEGDARALVRARTIDLTSRPRDELVKLVGQRFTTRIESEKGLSYDLETHVFWGGPPEAGEIFVAVSINDAGWEADEDFNDSFIMDSGGSIIGNSGF